MADPTLNHSIIQPIGWIHAVIFNFVGAVISSYILYVEWRKRKSTKILFISKYLKILPLICIINGTLTSLFWFANYFSWFCYFCYPLSWITGILMGIFMGYFQLSRLFYCFSESKIHSNRGYSNILFIIMFAIGILIIIFALFSMSTDLIYLKCGINHNFNFIEIRYDYLNISDSYSLRTALGFFFYIIWDLITLLLYYLKLVSFRRIMTDSVNDNVSRRIKYILNRIIILTILYELPIILIIFSVILVDINLINYNLWIILWSLFNVVGNVFMIYSMFLMQQHNTPEYEYFLKILNKYKIHYILFCCKSIVVEGLEYMLNNIETKIKHDANNNPPKEFDPDADTLYETHDISENHGKIPNKPNELSVETTIHVQKTTNTK